MKPELTPFEISIVVLAAIGYDNYIIGAKHGKSYSMIRQALLSIYRKLGFPIKHGDRTNIIRLTHYAIVNGYIQAGQCLS